MVSKLLSQYAWNKSLIPPNFFCLFYDYTVIITRNHKVFEKYFCITTKIYYPCKNIVFWQTKEKNFNNYLNFFGHLPHGLKTLKVIFQIL